MNIRKGDTFTFKPAYREAGDEKYTFMAIEDSSDGRVQYRALGGRAFAFPPINTASLDWIEAITGNMGDAVEQAGLQ